MFKVYNIDELKKELDKHRFKQLHIHHTWKPNHGNFKVNNHQSMQQGMKNYHTKNLGWSDIGQHLTLFPDGVWLAGRPFDIAPASIKGWNTGALAVEMVGNFDIGNDKLQGEQLRQILLLMKYFIGKYGEASIKFHREGPGVSKTCPGTSLNKPIMIKKAKNLGGSRLKESKLNIKIHNVNEEVEGIQKIDEHGNPSNYIPVAWLKRLGYEVIGKGNNITIRYKV